jgi:putative N6-adenine-specific DNA methylase
MTTLDNLTKDSISITLKCFFGFEETLAEELKELGYTDIVLLNRAVQIKGTWYDVYFLNLHIRCAISILVEIAQFRIHDEQDVYKKSTQIDWTTFFRSNQTFAIKGAVNSGLFKNSHFPFLLVKDAIVDCFRDKNLERPNIELKTPNILIDLYIRENMVTLSINTSGAPLFHRGYRTETGSAPLNEVVAACLIRLSGWDRKTTFLDPFSGSGTLVAEAALLASGIPSNIERQFYAFKNLLNYDSELWDSIYDAVNYKIRELPGKITGSDINDTMVLKARRNIRNFAFSRAVEINGMNFNEVKSNDEPVFIITNPPYGERMGDRINELYEAIGNWLKHSMTNSVCWIISSNDDALKSIGLKTSVRQKVFNGDLECSFRKFEIYAGSKKHVEPTE